MIHRACRLLLSLAIAGRTSADGSAEPTEASAMLASLCASSKVIYASSHGTAEQIPVITQTAYATLAVSTPSVLATLLAVYVTDTDDTLLALSRDVNAVNATTALALPLHAVEQPQRFKPHSVLRGEGKACTIVDGKPVDNWKARVENFDYEAAGGAHAGMHGGPGEAVLAAAVPRVSISADGENLTVTMARHPHLFIPLLYLKCASTNVLGLYTFEHASWPGHNKPQTAAEGGEGGEAPTADAQAFRATLDPWASGDCRRLFACAAMPAQESCGGFPQRCTQVDLLPTLVRRIEAASSGGHSGEGPEAVSSGPRGGRSGSHSTFHALHASAVITRNRQLVVSVGDTCDHMRLYLKNASSTRQAASSSSPPAAILAYGTGTLHLPLSPTNDTAAGAVRITRGSTLYLYRSCGRIFGPGAAPTVSSAPIRLAPLFAAHEKELAATAEQQRLSAAMAADSGNTSVGKAPQAALRPPPLPSVSAARTSSQLNKPSWRLSKPSLAVPLFVGGAIGLLLLLGALLGWCVLDRRAMRVGPERDGGTSCCPKRASTSLPAYAKTELEEPHLHGAD